MAHHAYLVTGENEQGIAAAEQFVQNGAPDKAASEVSVLRYGLFNVEDARDLADRAYRTTATGARSVLIVSVTRIFHEAQNALLKLFEEPPAGVTLILVVPSAGMLLPTLRSRLVPLPTDGEGSDVMPEIAAQFLAATIPEREKMIEKLVLRAKSDRDAEKQQARNDAVQLAEGLTRAAYATFKTTKDAKEKSHLKSFLEDLSHFQPILHERSAPLKLVFEHLLMTSPL